MTLYRIYVENGNRAGFWVQHRAWRNICALVRTIGGQDIGPLPGSAPAHDNAAVEMQVFDVRSGRPLETHPSMLQSPTESARSADDSADHSTDRQYTRIAEPFWYDPYDQKSAAVPRTRTR